MPTLMFNYVGSINGQGRKLRKVQCTASQDIAVGDAIQFSTTAGTVIPAVADEEIAGIVAGFVDKYGNAQPETTVTAGTAASTVKTSDSSTATSDYLLVDVNPGSLYSASLDADVGTTTGSNKAGVWFVLADEDDLDESSVINSYDTTGTMVHAYSHGLDPRNSARVIVNFVMAPYVPFV